MENGSGALAAVAQYKRSKDFAKRARDLLRVWTDEEWRHEGCASFRDWGNKFSGMNQSSVYLYVEIARHLAWLPDEQINRLGVGKCKYLMYLVKKSVPIDPIWIQKADDLDFPDFKRVVERELRKGARSEKYGERFERDFRGMAHAPVNEQGVVYLFGMVSGELGFIVEAVKREYPDCIAKQKISQNPERWQDVRIEFEYRSSGFHHPKEGSDLIVCWEDDLGPKAPLRVLELRSEIRKLSPNLRPTQTEPLNSQNKRKTRSA